MRMRNFNRTSDSPVFLNSHVKDIIKVAAKQLFYIVEQNAMDVGKDYEDIEGELFLLWCGHCTSCKELTEEAVIAGFEVKIEWYRAQFIKKYYSYIEGRTDRMGPPPFDPDFYQFTEMYRNGYTINELAEHYQVGEKTIRRYMEENFVTKTPIDPTLYIDLHEKIHGRDEAYWNIRSELITRFDID